MSVTLLRSRAGLLAVSGAGLLWGTTGVAVRTVQNHSPLGAISIGCYRMIISAVILIVFMRGAVWRRAALAWRTHRAALLVSGAGLGWYQALYFLGVQDVGVAVSTLISLGLAPIVLTFAAAVSNRKPPAATALGTVALAVGGLALVTLSAGHGAHAPHPVVGIVASAASGTGYAFVTIMNRRLVAAGDALALTGATSAIGALVLLPIAVPAGMGIPSSAVANGWLIYIGIVSTVVAYWLFYTGLRSTPTEVAGVLTLLEPLTAALLAAWLLGESLSAAGWLGTGLLLVAITGLYLKKPEAEPLPL